MSAMLHRNMALRAGVLALSLGGCERPATQLVVVIDSDLEPATELRRVRVQLHRENGAGAPYERTFDLRPRAAWSEGTTAVTGSFTLPGSIAVTSEPDDARRLIVDVSAFLPDDAGNFTQRAIVPFERESVVYLTMYLAGRCRLPENQQCAAGTVCGPHGCQPIVRAGETSPPTTVAPRDGGSDACVRSGDEQCYNGVDDDCDGHADEGCQPRSCARAEDTRFGLNWPSGVDTALFESHCSEETVTPSGAFTAGESQGSEGTVAGLTVSPFRIDRYEVTLARFRAFVAAGLPRPPLGRVDYPGGSLSLSTLRPSATLWPVEEPLRYSESNRFCHWSLGTLDREAQPLNCVDWFTAQAFCVWDGGRLPTEAEWEYAARHLSVPEAPPSYNVVPGRRYPWGEDENAWLCEGNYQEPDCARVRVPMETTYGTWIVARTAHLQPWYRVFDLSGNVAEWTADVYAPYASGCWSRRDDPLCATPVSALQFTTRGGGYNSLRTEVRGASRRAEAWSERARTLGFRCARTP